MTMSAYLGLHYHIVFSTKHREPLLAKDWRERLFSYMSGTIKGLEAYPQRTGGYIDHVHILCGMRATHRVSDVVREIKKASSVWVKEEVGIRSFAWQEGYAAFTVGYRQRDLVKAYIDGQEEHHRIRTYKEEVLGMLEENGVEYDPKYFV